MILVLQVAAGVVLAVLALTYRRQLLVLASIVAVLAIVVGVVLYVRANPDSWFASVAINLVLLLVGIPLLVTASRLLESACDALGDRIRARFVKKASGDR